MVKTIPKKGLSYFYNRHSNVNILRFWYPDKEIKKPNSYMHAGLQLSWRIRSEKKKLMDKIYPQSAWSKLFWRKGFSWQWQNHFLVQILVDLSNLKPKLGFSNKIYKSWVRIIPATRFSSFTLDIQMQLTWDFDIQIKQFKTQNSSTRARLKL